MTCPLWLYHVDGESCPSGILRRWGDGLGSGRLIAQGTVRANRVVGAPPAFDEHVGFPTRLEDLAIEQFVSQLAVETARPADAGRHPIAAAVRHRWPDIPECTHPQWSGAQTTST